jgi:hypothetical protein
VEDHLRWLVFQLEELHSTESLMVQYIDAIVSIHQHFRRLVTMDLGPNH